MAIVQELRQSRTADQERAERATGLLVRYLPTPSWESLTTAFEVKVAGVRRQAITFYCPDRVFLFLNAETGELRIDFKAKELWSHPWSVTAGRWLADLSLLLFGESCRLDEAYRVGWRMTGIEICADFVGMALRPEDVSRFVGGLANSAYTLADDLIDDDGEVEIEATVETINLGRRSGNVSLCIYDKTTQLDDVKGGDNACYVSSWIAGGYDGEAPITRVELRLARHGLQLATKHEDGDHAHSRLLLDFRDPATLADPKKIGVVWAHCTGQHRLVLGERTRLRRDALDPRWIEVVASGGADPPALRQFRQINADAWAKKVEGAVRGLVRSALHLAALHGVRSDDATAIATMARFAYKLAIAYGDDLPAHSDAYYALATPFVGPEIWSLGRQAWTEYETDARVLLPRRTFSVWTKRGAFDRAISQTGPPGLQPQKETEDG